MNVAQMIFLIFGFVCFALSAANAPDPPHGPRLLPLGLAFWILVVILEHADKFK